MELAHLRKKLAKEKEKDAHLEEEVLNQWTFKVMCDERRFQDDQNQQRPEKERDEMEK